MLKCAVNLNHADFHAFYSLEPEVVKIFELSAGQLYIFLRLEFYKWGIFFRIVH